MALLKCKECGKEVSDKAEKCPNCGSPVPKKLGIISIFIRLIGVGILILIFYAMFIAPSMNKPGLLEANYLIKVSGTQGLKFSGTYMTSGQAGKSESKTIDGTVPAQYEAAGMIVSVSFQKKTENGNLKVQIFKGGSVVAESETTAAYGVVSAATR